VVLETEVDRLSDLLDHQKSVAADLEIKLKRATEEHAREMGVEVLAHRRSSPFRSFMLAELGNDATQRDA
jgi:hypothetical protein